MEQPGHADAALKRLVRLGAAVLVLNLIATIVAVTVNWPAQFGGVGTDAGAEFGSRGTAISAPAPVMLALLIVLVLLRVGKAWTVLGIAAYGIVGLTLAIGGLGEALSEPTSDVPKAVLVMSGIAWTLIGATMIAAVATRRSPAGSRRW